MTDAADSDHNISLANPFVRTIAFGRLAGMAGLQIIIVAVGWQLYERTGSAFALGLVGLIELIPALFLAIPAGNIVDANPRRTVAMIGHAVMATAAFGLAMASVTGAPDFWIYAMVALVGVARVTAGPAVGTILPQLVKPAQFARANAWVSSGTQLASVSGPAIGGVLIAATGTATAAYLVAGALQMVFFVLLTTLPHIPPPPRAGRRSASEVFAGLRFVRRTPVFLAAITLDLFAVLLGGAVALLPIFAKDILHVGPDGLGWLRSAPAIGALAAALIQTRLPPWQRPGLVMIAAVVGFGVATIGFGLSETFWISMVCLILTGALDMLSVVIRVTMEQALTPDHLRGRVSSINFLFIGLSNELGAFESGATAALFGTVASVVGGGIGTLIVVAAVALTWPQLLRVGPLHTLRPNNDPAAIGGKPAAR
jgi:predicted MFS family arabinose efflux permease